jgi:hypothetical protein
MNEPLEQPIGPEQGLAELADLLDATREAVRAGALIDLAGLDREVDKVCRSLEDAAPERRPGYVRALQALVEAFDGLAADLEMQPRL